MDQEGLSQDAFSTIPLSPIPDSSSLDITEKMANQVPGSIFDPPGDSDIHSEQHDSEPYLTSEPAQSSSSFSHFESEGMLTRSKSGTSKRTTIAPDEENSGDTTVEKTRKIRGPRQKPSKGTQVMPRMLPPAKKRAPKKTNSEDSKSKENIPPKASKKQQRASKATVSEENKENTLMPPNAPKKLSLTRETDICNISGVKRRLSSSPSMDTSRHTDEDNAAPYESSIHDSSAIPSSSIYPANSSSMYEIRSIADDEDIREDERQIVPISLDETVRSSRSTASKRTMKTRSSNRKQPMAVILDQEMFKEGSTVEIKLNNGDILVNSKQGNPATPNKKSGRKDEKDKRNGGRKSRGRRSHKDSWTSSDSDSSESESSCSCSSCDPYDSYCSTCDDDSTSSSSDQCHKCRHR